MLRMLLAGMVGMLGLATLAAQEPGKLVALDYRELELRRTDAGWEVRCAGRVIKNVGPSEADAEEVISMMRHLRVTQHGTIGVREPVMEYWLADGKAPVGFIAPHQLTRIDRQTLRVELLYGKWCLRDARRLYFNFGTHESDARQALDVIRRYQFNQIGYIGRPVPVMIYFLSGADSDTERPGSMPAVQTAFSPLDAHQARQLTPPNLYSIMASAGEERLPFDWRRVQLRRDRPGQWQLVHGLQLLVDFGGDEVSARDALRAIQFYRFTEQCHVGKSGALRYFLVNGKPPQGVKLGINRTRFRTERLAVQEMDGVWLLCDGVVPILRADSQEDADLMLQVIKQHQFDHLCRIGSAEKGVLTFLVKDR